MKMGEMEETAMTHWNETEGRHKNRARDICFRLLWFGKAAQRSASSQVDVVRCD